MNILGLIPARGGSKGIPRKNIKLLNGKALINYTIELGLRCKLINHLVVSTDDIDISKTALRAGADVPFLRPSHLADDKSPTIDTVIHAINYFEGKNIFFDAVCLLQPTVPFRDIEDINDAIEKFIQQDTDSLISVREVPHIYNPHWVYEEDSKGLLNLAVSRKKIIPRRQELPKAFHRDGSIYLTKTDIIVKYNTLYGNKICYDILERSPNINIDTIKDWNLAEDYIINNLT